MKADKSPRLQLVKSKHFKDKVDLALARDLAISASMMLQQIYPGYAFGAKESVDGTVIDFVIGNIQGDYGFTIKTQQLQHGTGQKKLLMREAGALLERYKLARGGNVTDIRETGLTVDSRGSYIPLDADELS